MTNFMYCPICKKILPTKFFQAKYRYFIIYFSFNYTFFKFDKGAPMQNQQVRKEDKETMAMEQNK